jgi:hypothetical protein
MSVMLNEQQRLIAEQAKIYYQELTQKIDKDWRDTFILSCWADRYNHLTGNSIDSTVVATDPNI